MQSLHPVFMKVPRVLYVVLFTGISIGATIGGREHFGAIANNVAAVLSYWTVKLSLHFPVFQYR